MTAVEDRDARVDEQVDEPAEEPVEGRAEGPAQELAEGPAEEPEGRRYPSTIGGAFYLVILAVVVAGLGVAAFGPWRLGIQVVASALMAMAALRLVLRQRDAGMLAVRHRLVDAVLLAGSAGVLFFLAATIPNQPG